MHTTVPLTPVRRKHILKFYRIDTLINVGLALLLAAALALSGLASRLRTRHLFQVGSSWDPGILIALAVCLFLNCISFSIIRKKRYRSLRKGVFDKPEPLTAREALKLCLGSSVMGVAWGIADMDASSMLTNLQFMTPHVCLVYLPAFILGQVVAFLVDRLVRKCRRKTKESESRTNRRQFQN